MSAQLRKYLLSLLVLLFELNSFSLSIDSIILTFKSLNSNKINIQSEINTNKACVFVFFSPACPICQSQTKTLNDLFSRYNKDSIRFILVFPGNYYSKKKISNFLKTYNISIPAIIDKNMHLTKALKATVTPEAVVIDNNKNRIYSGKIDNRFEDIGKRRTIITEQYLQDAIDAILHNKLPAIERTEPVGCILNLENN